MSSFVGVICVIYNTRGALNLSLCDRWIRYRYFRILVHTLLRVIVHLYYMNHQCFFNKFNCMYIAVVCRSPHHWATCMASHQQTAAALVTMLYPSNVFILPAYNLSANMSLNPTFDPLNTRKNRLQSSMAYIFYICIYYTVLLSRSIGKCH